jgi:hypothetical protein
LLWTLTRRLSPRSQTVVWNPTTYIGAVPASAGYNFGVYIDQGKIVKADDALPELELSASEQDALHPSLPIADAGGVLSSHDLSRPTRARKALGA